MRIVMAAVRVWTRVYTWRLPEPVRERRRAEIECDIWESQHDTQAGRGRGFQLIARLVLGVVDDVQWRAEQIDGSAQRKPVVALSVGAAVLLACMLFAIAARSVDPPQPPPAPALDWRHGNRTAPPPPPPPPCNPPGIGRPAFSPCTPY
jgi:hypothetical protein